MDNSLKEKLIALEKDLHTREVRTSHVALSSLLAEDFREIGAGGLYFGKKEALESLPDEENIEIKATDFEFRLLSNEIAHITYKSNLFDESGTHIRTSYRTSIWKYDGIKWQMIFHQGTITH